MAEDTCSEQDVVLLLRFDGCRCNCLRIGFNLRRSLDPRLDMCVVFFSLASRLVPVSCTLETLLLDNGLLFVLRENLRRPFQNPALNLSLL